MAKFDHVQKLLIRVFSYYGGFVARHAIAVLLFSLAVGALMSCGVIFLTFDSNTGELFSPIASRAKTERDLLEELFPTNFDMFTPARVTSLDQRSVVVIVTAKDRSNILQKSHVAEIMELRKTIETTRAETVNGTFITYESVCARWRNACIPNPVIEFWEYMGQMNSSTVSLPTPFWQLPSGERVSFEGFIAPGVEEDQEIVYTEALAFYLYLRHEPPEMRNQSGLWEDAVARQLANQISFNNIEVLFFTSDAVDEAQNRLALSVIPYFCITFMVLSIFSVATCLMSDWVQSKPWLANSGILSACLAIGSAIGLLSFCGVPFNQVVASMPFLAVGIGIDDMFIMVAAWRRTDRYATVEVRMSKALSEAAVSITITSLTDFLGFCVAAITPLPAVRSFCLFTGVAILMDFFFQVTFFASMMVFSGQREASNRHCYTCREVVPKGEAPSALYALFCSGGTGGKQHQHCSTKVHLHAVMKFFRNKFAPFITRPFVMAVVAFCYVVYLVLSVYGCFILNEGLSISNLAEEGSNTNRFFKASEKYFNEYGPTVSVVINEELNYWEGDVQRNLTDLLTRFQTNEYAGNVISSEFWLDDFKAYADEMEVVLSDKDTFMSLLKNKFLKNPSFERYAEDINFDKVSGERITSSRFLLTFDFIDSTLGERDLMLQTRSLADQNPESIELVVFSAKFIIFEQYVIILPNTIQSLSIAVVAMLLVALLLIPSVPVAIVVAISVLSIETGVIGFMSLMGVPLDGISMINIIICIGFSIDFSAHICYAFVSQSTDLTTKEKIANALCSLGYPVLQSGVSTFLSLLPLLGTKSYIFITFAKVNSLVMIFGMLHGLVFLPVFLAVVASCWPARTKMVELDKNGTVSDEAVEKAEPDTSKRAAVGTLAAGAFVNSAFDSV